MTYLQPGLTSRRAEQPSQHDSGSFAPQSHGRKPTSDRRLRTTSSEGILEGGRGPVRNAAGHGDRARTALWLRTTAAASTVQRRSEIWRTPLSPGAHIVRGLNCRGPVTGLPPGRRDHSRSVDRVDACSRATSRPSLARQRSRARGACTRVRCALYSTEPWRSALISMPSAAFSEAAAIVAASSAFPVRAASTPLARIACEPTPVIADARRRARRRWQSSVTAAATPQHREARDAG